MSPPQNLPLAANTLTLLFSPLSEVAVEGLLPVCVRSERQWVQLLSTISREDRCAQILQCVLIHWV